MEPYDADSGRLIAREMAEVLALDLVKKNLVTSLYDRIVDPGLLVRRFNVAACNVVPADANSGSYVQMDLFTDFDALEKQREEEKREKNMQEAILKLQEKFGKNAVLKGMNLQEGATTIRRNSQIGGHRAE